MPRPIQNSFDRLIFLFLFSLRRIDESRILTKLQGFDFEHEDARLLDTNEIIVYKKWAGVKEERDWKRNDSNKVSSTGFIAKDEIRHHLHWENSFRKITILLVKPAQTVKTQKLPYFTVNFIIQYSKVSYMYSKFSYISSKISYIVW